MEEPFTNEAIDTTSLPRFEEVQLTPLHPLYIRIIWFNIALIFVALAIAAALGLYYIDDLQPYKVAVGIGYFFFLSLTIAVNLISFKTRGFKFREHDVIYRNGAISVTTIIIPYNRVQHVAIHEGPVARWLGMATVQVFTAGGMGGDIKIPGIEKIHASAIKKLVAGKIDNKQQDEEKDLFTAATRPYPSTEEADNEREPN